MLTTQECWPIEKRVSLCNRLIKHPVARSHLGICEEDDSVVGSSQRADVHILALVVPAIMREVELIS
jgi:hypothetical protein